MSSKDASRWQLTGLGLRNWRTIETADVTLGPLTVVTGWNGDGKSNLLDALMFMSDVATAGMSRSVAVRGGIDQVRNAAAKRSDPVELRVTLRDCWSDVRWTYELALSCDRSRDACPLVEREVVTRNNMTLLERVDLHDSEEEAWDRRQTHLAQVAANGSFRCLTTAMQQTKSAAKPPTLPTAPTTPTTKTKTFSLRKTQGEPAPPPTMGFPPNCGGLVSRCWLVRSRLGWSCRVCCGAVGCCTSR